MLSLICNKSSKKVETNTSKRSRLSKNILKLCMTPMVLVERSVKQPLLLKKKWRQNFLTWKSMNMWSFVLHKSVLKYETWFWIVLHINLTWLFSIHIFVFHFPGMMEKLKPYLSRNSSPEPQAKKKKSKTIGVGSWKVMPSPKVAPTPKTKKEKKATLGKGEKEIKTTRKLASTDP